jgi:geranylgeranyl reductase
MNGLSWFGIFRLGLVQAALGSVVVLMTSTLNRVMVVELAAPAMLAGLLVGLHHAVQLSRPHWGHASDGGKRRTPWIIGGVALLAVGGVMAAAGTALMAERWWLGIAVATLAFALIGLGVGAAGTTLLAMLAREVVPERRAPAASLVWMMMIAGFILTTLFASANLDPFSMSRLVGVTAVVSLSAFLVTLVAMWGVESSASTASDGAAPAESRGSFGEAFRTIWDEPRARAFTVFILLSMLAYSTQDLILEPFAGAIFGFSPGESTGLTSMQNGGALSGMLLVALLGKRFGKLEMWTILGCISSGLALATLPIGAQMAADWPLRAHVFMLGLFNGVFAVGAIGWMMALAGEGASGREGIRMGLWGGAQSIAVAVGAFLGTVGFDVTRTIQGSAEFSYGVVFVAEAGLFVVAAVWAARMTRLPAAAKPTAHHEENETIVASSHPEERWDAIVVGGGPAGATAAQRLATAGHRVMLLDRGGRIKPCGGAIPPRAIRDFEIPGHLLCARISSARIISPSDKRVNMPIEGGFVGMVDRGVFDEFLRVRAAENGAERVVGRYERMETLPGGEVRVQWREDGGARQSARARLLVGADGALSAVAKQALPGTEPPCVFAYHEIVEAPVGGDADYQGDRCDVIYRGQISPDFYGWVFPHGATASVGTGSANKGFSLRGSAAELRAASGLADAKTVRREGAPIPMQPRRRWDDGRNVVLAGDAAGVVAPSSGEGIYYAMVGGEVAAEAGVAFLQTGDARALGRARQRFMRAHGQVFWILGMMQWFWYCSDARRERFVRICDDPDVQKLTWEAYMNKELVRARPAAHARIFFKDVAHLLGLARA